ncbi:3-methyl-2-oxobutanoate hydroxymethyltransferase [Streptomyces sp. NPDC001034]|uniref:3-methyl-2-oxobutanoate hydroxymethyltransferase n=1 Tax=Streptomyces sp. NPDC001034 TaxID=3154375 RepID=UPI003318E01B
MSEEPASESRAAFAWPARGRVRTTHLLAAKAAGHRWAMLTSYDQYTAALFDAAGVPVLLVGDSAADNVFGHDTTIPVTVDEMLPLVRAVTRSAPRSLVVADLPFGSYEEDGKQALRTARSPRFVRRYADLAGELDRAVREFAADVHAGAFPGPEHSFD